MADMMGSGCRDQRGPVEPATSHNAPLSGVGVLEGQPEQPEPSMSVAPSVADVLHEAEEGRRTGNERGALGNQGVADVLLDLLHAT